MRSSAFSVFFSIALASVAHGFTDEGLSFRGDSRSEAAAPAIDVGAQWQHIAKCFDAIPKDLKSRHFSTTAFAKDTDGSRVLIQTKQIGQPGNGSVTYRIHVTSVRQSRSLNLVVPFSTNATSSVWQLVLPLPQSNRPFILTRNHAYNTSHLQEGALGSHVTDSRGLTLRTNWSSAPVGTSAYVSPALSDLRNGVSIIADNLPLNVAKFCAASRIPATNELLFPVFKALGIRVGQ